MRTPDEIILGPIITEKAMDEMAYKKYTFRVVRDANKAEIRHAVETAFEGVKVARVNTMNMRGKSRRQGMYAFKDSDWKKAIVTLTPDSEGIQFFEEMR